ncbi:hypothetical protein Tco_0472364 [Tanacetum coccineum]
MENTLKYQVAQGSNRKDPRAQMVECGVLRCWKCEGEVTELASPANEKSRDCQGGMAVYGVGLRDSDGVLFIGAGIEVRVTGE